MIFTNSTFTSDHCSDNSTVEFTVRVTAITPLPSPTTGRPPLEDLFCLCSKGTKCGLNDRVLSVTNNFVILAEIHLT